MTGIKDRVAIAGVGCTRFTEHWAKDQDDLLIEAVGEALADAGIGKSDLQALWVGIYYPWTGVAGTTASDPLDLFGIPATRVENYCASGMDAFRNASLAVASGVYDIVLACGVEKITDQGTSGLPQQREAHPVFPTASAPALFAMAANRTFYEWDWSRDDLAQVAVKNHANGAKHPKAHFQKEVDAQAVLTSPMISDPLGRLDCCPVSDGAAALVLTRPEIARTLAHKDDYVLVKANALASYTAYPMYDSSSTYLGFPSTQKAARMAYEEAGIRDPARDISFAEVHDCFTITELLNCQDLGFCEPGAAPSLIRSGRTAVEGEQPVNPSGGLKSFGHPIGATGCRMLYEVTRQLQGRADGAQVKDPVLGLAHNLGGPAAVAAVTILGRSDA